MKSGSLFKWLQIVVCNIKHKTDEQKMEVAWKWPGYVLQGFRMLLASLPGLHQLQCLIACSMHNSIGKAWEIL